MHKAATVDYRTCSMEQSEQIQVEGKHRRARLSRELPYMLRIPSKGHTVWDNGQAGSHQPSRNSSAGAWNMPHESHSERIGKCVARGGAELEKGPIQFTCVFAAVMGGGLGPICGVNAAPGSTAKVEIPLLRHQSKSS